MRFFDIVRKHFNLNRSEFKHKHITWEEFVRGANASIRERAMHEMLVAEDAKFIKAIKAIKDL